MPDRCRSAESRAIRGAVDALWDETTAFLRDRDPENGWPLFLMAYGELMRSVRVHTVEVPDSGGEGQPIGETRYEVVAPDGVARAARLLREAVRKPRFDQAADEIGVAEFRRLGGRAETLSAAMAQWSFFHGLLHPGFMRMRRTIQRMTGTFAAANGPGSSDAFGILDDLQTMIARAMAGETTHLPHLAGVSLARIVVGEGGRALRESGRADEAGRLHERGRRLFRPWLVGRAMRLLGKRDRFSGPVAGNPSGETDPFLDDPVLLAEARAALDRPVVRPEGWRDPGREADESLLFSLLTPVRSDVVWAREPASGLDDVRIAVRFEYYALQVRAVVWAVIAQLGLALILFLATYGAALALYRPEDGDGTPPWPGWRWTLGAAAAAAALSFGLFYTRCRSRL